jgi:hypothetical protein
MTEIIKIKTILIENIIKKRMLGKVKFYAKPKYAEDLKIPPEGLKGKFGCFRCGFAFKKIKT